VNPNYDYTCAGGGSLIPASSPILDIAARLDPQIDMIVSGHSHVPKIETIGGVLYLNPGSAGPRRFKLPISLATVEVMPESLRPEVHNLSAG